MNRRDLMFGTSAGFGGLALCSLLACNRASSPTAVSNAPDAAPPQIAKPSFGRAKNVIFLFMNGGPGQMDTFDPKPRLDREHGQIIQMETPATTFNVGKRVLKSPFKFQRYGESGAEVSDLFPEVAQHVDKMTIVRSMVTDHAEHAAANYFMHTGWPLQGRPSMGAWVSYGLSSLNSSLPTYVVLEGGILPIGGAACFGNGFLPAGHRGAIFRKPPHVIPDIVPAPGPRELQAHKLVAIDWLNRRAHVERGGSSELDAIITNYELAAKMQDAIPSVVDLSKESAETRRLYGIGQQPTDTFGTQCLLARRLVQQGVRFVQLLPPPIREIGSLDWDQHAMLLEGHRSIAERIDRPIAGLLHDLNAHGMLEDTVVLWAGEFGRTPMQQTEVGVASPGRDHNPFGFTIWMAGGGVQPGLIYGATDEYGLRAVENPVHLHDLHATLLHLLGIDHEKLTYEYGGREFRLTDVFGRVVHDILA
jgi:hypothetical protein